ncbi:xanthine dehydrogenase family protein molybdopterin-binding subunit [Paludibaculum fermentans]|uniref:Xanthine dehydrogenase family protein molybdopterin-binding subunit n=1 Tax=Paludibaculum fermentans TaxID=1473598 RepID=A0A7S7SQ52_PALFE|nr:molybdopterin cofactor-binding domain-containing protein [Paludibaculum fermentans]QOY91855.1 xanthine dehydrogenase family protein molybdopterin-binding subunit [Paludibaculum fermentans]
MSAVYRLDRREFLGGLFSAGALVLAAPMAVEGAVPAFMPTVYLGVEPDGTVVIVAHRSEMGTGIRTSLPMVAADELGADWKRVRIEQALGDEKYGSQNTDGSCSIRDFYDALRDAGATARMMLERAAAAQWQVPLNECSAVDHEIVHRASGKKAGFGALVAAAAKQPVPAKADLKLKPASEFKYIGKGVPMADQNDIVRGKGTFGYDAKMPGMLYASIERPPVVGGSVKSFDGTAAKAVKGVKDAIVLPTFQKPYGYKQLGGVAVLADNTWAAMEGRKKLQVEWNGGENESFDSDAFRKKMSETVRSPQKAARNKGDVEKAFASAAKTHEAEYYTPLLSHAPMEPPAAVAEFKDGKVTAWAATQNPQAVQEAVSEAMGIPKTDVLCHVTLLGGGFGRKSKPDYVVEAALLSKQVGRPVKVSWTRQDDIKFDYYHACASIYMKAGLNAQGRPDAWLQRVAAPSLMNLYQKDTLELSPLELGLGFIDVPFDIANLRVENGPAAAHVRIGWLRSVNNIQHAFAIHSFVDELAHLAGRDTVDYTMDLIGPARRVDFSGQGFQHANYGQKEDKFPFDTARLRRVIEVAAEKSGWSKNKSAPGHAWGFAAHRSFLCYVATVVEVKVDKDGKLTIPTVHYAIDPGQVIHPDRVISQFQGAAVFGTSGALLGEITATGGKVKQANFNNYPVARMNEAPQQVHVHIVPSNEPPGGVGEPGVPTIAPALANAIFAATGKRIRELPLKKTKLV